MNGYRLNKDVLYNILLQSNSFNLQKLCLVNKDTVSICNDKQFWIDKFKGIPMVNELNFDEYQRYEKCQSIVKNVRQLMKLENPTDKYQIGVIEFKNENILQYLPIQLIDVIKKDIIYNELLDEVPFEIAKQLNINSKNQEIYYLQSFFFSLYDDNKQYNPSISYTLFTEDEVISTDIYTDIEEILVKLLYVFPEHDLHDSDNITYLPNILYKYKVETLKNLRLIIQSRHKYWLNKQWFL
jgi:hypothetical protein